MIEYNLDYYNNIILLESSEIIKLTEIETQLYCESLGIPYNIKHKDIKRLYYNFYLLRLFNYIVTESKKRHVVIFVDKRKKLLTFQTSLLKKTSTLLPINVIYYPDSIDSFQQKTTSRDEDAIVIIDSIKRDDIINNTFRKLKKFLRDNKLQYLDNQYLNSINLKFCLLTGINK